MRVSHFGAFSKKQARERCSRELHRSRVWTHPEHWAVTHRGLKAIALSVGLSQRDSEPRSQDAQNSDCITNLLCRALMSFLKLLCRPKFVNSFLPSTGHILTGWKIVQTLSLSRAEHIMKKEGPRSLHSILYSVFSCPNASVSTLQQHI